jgi:deoxyribonuclease-4
LRFGAHLSIGKGWTSMAGTAREEGMETVQVFSRSPRGGAAKPIDPKEAARMQRELEDGGVTPLVVHVPYFVNLATDVPNNREYTLETLALDLVRAGTLGSPFVVTHLGSSPGDRDEALERVATAVAAVLEASLKADPAAEGVALLLENSGGGGGDVGGSLGEIATVMRAVGSGNVGRLGVCLDTCHALVAGYDLRGRAGLRTFLDEVEGVIGLARVKVLHLNDSLGELGSHRDRHAAIGQGHVGLESFRALVAEPQLADRPGLLETPDEGRLADLERLKAMRDEMGR